MKQKTIRLTESELNEMVLHRVRSIVGEEPVFPSDRFVRRPSRESSILESALLGEGLIRTYPFEWVGKYLQRNANSDFISIMANDIEKKFNVTMKRQSKSVGPLKHAMETFGYYCGYELDDKANNQLILQFEPKFDEYIKGSEFSAPTSVPLFFHVAPHKYKDKILRDGLIPRHRNKLFKYPDRVYVMLAFDGLDAAYEMASMLYAASGYKDGEGTYALFGINVSGVEDTKFYRDWNVEHARAYYTHENIPPTSISYLTSLELSSY